MRGPSLSRIFVWLCVGFILWAVIWMQVVPPGVVGDYLGTVGHWLMVAVQKLAEFIGGLA